MSPLAQRVARELTLPPQKRTFRDGANVFGRWDDLHIFDVASISDLVKDVAQEFYDAGAPMSERMFLPSRRTWIEIKDGPPEMARIGLHLDAGRCATLLSAVSAIGSVQLGYVKTNTAQKQFDDYAPIAFEDFGTQAHWWAYAALALINTPQVIGRTLHAPHRGLQRALNASRIGPGRFPLRAWTEITIRTDTKAEFDAPAVYSGLTGMMPLHWVRAHKRRINGIVMLVEAYWRGDPALGIKQSRYRVAA